jgi:hypothetical protein
MSIFNNYLQNPENPEINFYLGYEYESQKQYASAISFYLRAAERSFDADLQYECLLRNFLCFNNLEDRNFTAIYQLQRAISINSKRPEAYFLLSRFYEYNKDYQHSYLFSSIGLNVSDFSLNCLLTDVEYPGKYGLLFEKAVSSWWIGSCEESRELMFDLKNNYNINDEYKKIIDNNINIIGYPKRFYKLYYKTENTSPYIFKNIEIIDQNYSQVYQDLFVLYKLNGKFGGSYLEIGCNDPFVNNNTHLLESKFKWKGLSIDIDFNMIEKFRQNRFNPSICKDATTIDYNLLLKDLAFPLNIDYLSIDCEPNYISFDVLKKIINSNYIFNIVTFEHDYYIDKSVRDESREFMIKNNYIILEKDVTCDGINSFEDWYCHISLI